MLFGLGGQQRIKHLSVFTFSSKCRNIPLPHPNTFNGDSSNSTRTMYSISSQAISSFQLVDFLTVRITSSQNVHPHINTRICLSIVYQLYSLAYKK